MNKIRMILIISLLSSSLLSKEFSALSLNTWMIPFQGKKVNQRLKQIKKIVKNYDISGFQEVFGRRKRRIIRSGAPSGWSSSVMRGSFPRINSGLVNISKFKMIKNLFYPFQKCKGGQCFAKKGVLYSFLNLGDGIFLNLYNTHLQAYTSDRGVREAQLKTLKFALKRNDNGYPVILMGDLNIIADTNEHTDFNRSFPMLFDSWSELRPSDSGYTWDQDRNYYARRYSKREDPPAQRLDYIYYAHGIKHQVTPLEMNVLDQGIELSDHYGISASFDIN